MLAALQDLPDSGNIFFRQDQSGRNHLEGTLSYRQNGKLVEIEGSITGQAGGDGRLSRAAEAYYFVPRNGERAYLLVAFAEDGSRVNLASFKSGGTYQISEDIQCRSFFSPAVIDKLEEPGDPAPERFVLPEDGQGEGGSPDSSPDLQDLIKIIDPEGERLPDQAFRVEVDPDGSSVQVDLEDADPDRPGDQPFGDGGYTVRIREEEIGKIVVQTDELRQVFGGPCVEALVVATAGRSTQKSSRKAGQSARSRSRLLEKSQRSSKVDLLTGTSSSDSYELGNATAAFYAASGNRDYVRITKFASDDVLQLHGRPADYSKSGFVALDGHSGYGVLYQGDLIALIQSKQAGSLVDLLEGRQSHVHYL